MEVDAPEHTRRSPFLAYFDTTSSSFPFRPPTVSQIQHRRALLTDQLIFDILLSSGGIRVPDLIYPPRDEESLRKLLDAIAESQYDILKKDCLVYFLLKWHQDGREDRFKATRCIPPQFAALADAYWYLDAGVQVHKAVSLLSDARLNRDYASKILQAISLSPDSAALIRQYVRTAQPSLTEPDDLDLYALALAENSLFDAWQFQRTFPETKEVRPRLWKKLVEWCITPEPKPIPLKHLLHLPLSSYEESQLHTYATKPSIDIPLSSICVLQDLICVRLIRSGRYSDAIKMDRKFLSSPTKGCQEAKDRSHMIGEVFGALTSVERSLVKEEIDGKVEKREERPKMKSRKSVGGGIVLNASTAGGVGEEGGMSMSWEDIRVSDATPTASIGTPLREGIPERSGAPRFGGPIPAPSATPAANAVPTVPVVPLTTSAPQTSAFTPRRKSLPLTSAPLSSSVLSLGKGRPPLSGVGHRMSLGANAAVASPASGLQFASPSQQTPKAVGFTSASKHANAFYQPPAREKEKEKEKERETTIERVVEEPWRVEDEPPVPKGLVRALEKEEEDVLMQTDREDEEMKERNGKENGNETENEGLSYSVFGTSSQGPSAVGGFSPQRIQAHSPAHKALSQSVPGGFVSEDEEHEHLEEQEEPVAPKPRRTRTTKTTSTRTKKKEPRVSIPGALFADAEDEEENEDVAPLRSASPTNTRKGVRKGRSTASLSVNSDLDEGEGMQTRRRSSRLSHAGNAPVASAEDSVSTVVAGGTKVRKTRTAAGKKRK